MLKKLYIIDYEINSTVLNLVFKLWSGFTYVWEVISLILIPTDIVFSSFFKSKWLLVLFIETTFLSSTTWRCPK